MRLNEQQERALGMMVEFVEDSEDRAFCLSGYAGTGKTTTIQRLIPKLEGYYVAFTAPTHKAVKVLRDMATKAGLEVGCNTIHSLLGLRLSRQGDREVIKKTGKSQAHKFELVVVDECSMVGDELFKHIMMSAEINRFKVIFMGDPAQLPPVGEGLSKTLEINGALLTEVMRQRGENPILGYCTDIRNQLAQSYIRLPSVSPFCSEDGGLGLHVMAGDYFTSYMPHAFSHDNFDDDPDRFRVVAWRNVTVNRYNRDIQAFRYPGLMEPFADGEPVVVSSPVKRQAIPGDEKIVEDDVVINTETEGRIVGVPERFRHPSLNIDAWIVSVDFFCWEPCARIKLWALDAAGVRLHEELCRRLAAEAREKKGDWFSFWKAKDAFASLRPAYAMTAHKSQGSTFENVFVDVSDIWLNPNKDEALQCLYVAASRASHHLIMNASGF